MLFWAMAWLCLLLLLIPIHGAMAVVVDSTLDVTADDGVTTLREAVLAGGPITFDPQVFALSQTIELASQLSRRPRLAAGGAGHPVAGRQRWGDPLAKDRAGQRGDFA